MNTLTFNNLIATIREMHLSGFNNEWIREEITDMFDVDLSDDTQFGKLMAKALVCRRLDNSNN